MAAAQAAENHWKVSEAWPNNFDAGYLQLFQPKHTRNIH